MLHYGITGLNLVNFFRTRHKSIKNAVDRLHFLWVWIVDGLEPEVMVSGTKIE